MIEQCGFNELKISSQCANTTKTLPLIHRDPFDRMLIAQAIEHNLTLITVDGFIKQYDRIKVIE